MTNTGPGSAQTSKYRFSRPGGIEIETRELSNDEEAELVAREISRAQEVPVVIERFGHVDWEYVTEADERP
jgi:hypothetical protein